MSAALRACLALTLAVLASVPLQTIISLIRDMDAGGRKRPTALRAVLGRVLFIAFLGSVLAAYLGPTSDAVLVGTLALAVLVAAATVVLTHVRPTGGIGRGARAAASLVPLLAFGVFIEGRVALFWVLTGLYCLALAVAGGPLTHLAATDPSFRGLFRKASVSHCSATGSAHSREHDPSKSSGVD
jgi:hypothetical protein